MPPPPFRRLSLSPGGLSARAPNPDTPGNEMFRSRTSREGDKKNSIREWARDVSKNPTRLSKKGSRGRRAGIGRGVPRRTPTSGPSAPSNPARPGVSPMNRRPPSFESRRLPDRQRFAPAQKARRSILGGIGTRFRKLFGL